MHIRRVLAMFVIFERWSLGFPPLHFLSGPCSKETYPRECRIAVPASLMRVDGWIQRGIGWIQARIACFQLWFFAAGSFGLFSGIFSRHPKSQDPEFFGFG